MSKLNHQLIIANATELFAIGGLAQFSMRNLAKKLEVAPSVIYHHFTDENALLRSMFEVNSKDLGVKRKLLPTVKTTSALLKQRINFQIDNSLQVVTILKYYLAFRKDFAKTMSGFVPDSASLHMEEVLDFARKKRVYNAANLKDDAKVMTHAVNGYILEYYPYVLKPNEKRKLVDQIFNFLYKGIKGGKA